MLEQDTTTGEELGSGAFLKLREAKRNERESGSALKRKRRDEARAAETLDARLHSKLDHNDKVQLNTRVRPMVKNLVVELSRDNKMTVAETIDMILCAYFQIAPESK